MIPMLPVAILSGGLATRLRPATETISKASPLNRSRTSSCTALRQNINLETLAKSFFEGVSPQDPSISDPMRRLCERHFVAMNSVRRPFRLQGPSARFELSFLQRGVPERRGQELPKPIENSWPSPFTCASRAPTLFRLLRPRSPIRRRTASAPTCRRFASGIQRDSHSSRYCIR